MQGDPAIVLSGAVTYKDHKKFNAIIKSRHGTVEKSLGFKYQNLSGWICKNNRIEKSKSLGLNL